MRADWLNNNETFSSCEVVNPGPYCWRIGGIRAALLKDIRKGRVEQAREKRHCL